MFEKRYSASDAFLWSHIASLPMLTFDPWQIPVHLQLNKDSKRPAARLVPTTFTSFKLVLPCHILSISIDYYQLHFEWHLPPEKCYINKYLIEIWIHIYAHCPVFSSYLRQLRLLIGSTACGSRSLTPRLGFRSAFMKFISDWTQDTGNCGAVPVST